MQLQTDMHSIVHFTFGYVRTNTLICIVASISGASVLFTMRYSYTHATYVSTEII